MNKLLIILTLIFMFGCEDRKYTYVDSSIGVLSHIWYECMDGLVVNHIGVYLLNKESKVVPCKGYLQLTDKEYETLSQENKQ